jgi:DNA-directed RNA polymerase sigma subunit (sigma70/sigma32)
MRPNNPLPFGALSGACRTARYMWDARNEELPPVELDLLADISTPDCVDQLVTTDYIAKLLPVINDRSLAIIRWRFFHGYTYEEIAAFLDISKERVRQVERKALRLMWIHALKTDPDRYLEWRKKHRPAEEETTP